MPGSVLAVGVLGVAASLTVALCAGAAAAVASQRIAGVADSAALAAADAASGAVGGEPCTRARQLADASASRLVSCEVEGLIATVCVAARFGRIELTATARAGPPP